MRWVYLALVVLLTLAVLAFKLQNLSSVTVSWLNLSLTMPLSGLLLLVYFLGMVSGSFVVQLVRTWVDKARGAES